MRADILQTLLPLDSGKAKGEGVGERVGEGEREGGKELIPFNQVIMRGEDVTGQSVCQGV